MVRHIWTCHQLVERGSLHPHGVHSCTLLYNSILVYYASIVCQYTSTLVRYQYTLVHQSLVHSCTLLVHSCTPLVHSLYTSHQSTLVHFQYTLVHQSLVHSCTLLVHSYTPLVHSLYTSHQSTLVHFQFTDTGTPLLAQQYTCTKVAETINCSQVHLHCLPLSRIALQCTTLQSQDTEAGYLVWAGIHQQLHGEEGSRGQGKGRGLLVLQNFSIFSVELPTCTFQLQLHF